MKEPAKRTSIEQLRKAKWDEVEKELITKFQLLRHLVFTLEPSPINDKIANDLILPALRAAGHFCNTVKIEGEKPENPIQNNYKPVRGHAS